MTARAALTLVLNGQKFRADLVAVRDDIDEFGDDLADAGDRARGASDDVGRLGESGRRTGNLFAGAGGAIRGFVAGFVTLEAVKAVAGVAAEVESLNGQLVTLTGNRQSAAAVYADIERFAADTPFQLNEVVQAYVKLKNLGLDPSEAALRSYGNTAVAMGKSLDQLIEAVADASTFEFERLKEFGIRAAQQGDTVRFTFQGVTTEVRRNADDIQSYLRGLGDEKFGDAMAQQMSTLSGVASNLQDAIAGLTNDLAGKSGFSEALRDAGTWLTGLLNQLRGAPADVDAAAAEFERLAGLLDRFGSRTVRRGFDADSVGDDAREALGELLESRLARNTPDSLREAGADIERRRQQLQAEIDSRLAAGERNARVGRGGTAGSVLAERIDELAELDRQAVRTTAQLRELMQTLSQREADEAAGRQQREQDRAAEIAADQAASAAERGRADAARQKRQAALDEQRDRERQLQAALALEDADRERVRGLRQANAISQEELRIGQQLTGARRELFLIENGLLAPVSEALRLELERAAALEAQRGAAVQSVQARRDELELSQRLRQEADRAIRQDPMARVFGVDGIDELTARLDLGKAAALDFGEVLNQSLSKAGDATAEMITNMILLGDAGDFSAKQIAAALVRDLVRGLVSVGLQMVANAALARILGTTATVAGTAEAGVLAAAWTPAAYAASVATLGAAAGIGAAAFATGQATSLAATATASAAGGALGVAGAVPGRRFGGGVRGGQPYEMGEGGMAEILRLQDGRQIVVPGDDGRVIPSRAMNATPLSGGTVQLRLTVVNETGTASRARVEQQPDGGMLIRLMKAELARDVAAGGEFSQQLEVTYPLARRGV